MSSRHDDVLVLGAGVIGLSSALALLERGMRVRVLERSAVGSGASHGNCGTITPSHAIPLARPGVIGKALRWLGQNDAPLYVRPGFDVERMRWLLGFARRATVGRSNAAMRARATILNRSRTLLERNIASHGLDCGFQPSGALHVFRDPEVLAAEARDLGPLATVGIRSAQLDSAEAREIEPMLRDGMAGAIHFPDDACLRPERLVQELARRVRELGGTISEQTTVHALHIEGDRVRGVATDAGRIACGQVIAALGAWNVPWARLQQLRVPIQPGKGYSQTWERPAQGPRMPLVLAEPAVCVTCWEDGFRLGSTMEFSGFDESLNPVRLAALERGAATYLRHAADTRLLEQWWGWRPMSIDDVPIIGRSSRLRGLLWATGHGMLGVSMSAATGELVGALCADVDIAMDPTPYAPSRFHL